MCDVFVFLFQAEDGIRGLIRSRGRGDVYKRQVSTADLSKSVSGPFGPQPAEQVIGRLICTDVLVHIWDCLLYTSDAADERSSVDLGGRRIIKKKKTEKTRGRRR